MVDISEVEHPKVLADAEIELYLKGDRREIDRLILTSLNTLAKSFEARRNKEEAVSQVLNTVGGLDAIKARAKFVDSLIEKNEARSEMMSKVGQSAITWALIAFLGFIAVSAWTYVVQVIKTKSGV